MWGFAADFVQAFFGTLQIDLQRRPAAATFAAHPSREYAMNRYFGCVVLVPILILAVTAGPAVAELHCVPPAADLGEIRSGQPRQYRVELVNGGSQTIEILDVERGCGCLEPRLDRRSVPPGAKATLLVELRTSGQPNGPRSWNLRVRYRDGDATCEELLVLSATIRNEVTVQPSILVLDVRDVLHQEVSVTDLRSPPLKVTAVQASSDAVRAAVQSREGGVTKLLLEVRATALAPGSHDTMLNIYTDDPLYSPLQLPLTLSRAGDAAIAIVPAEVKAHVSAAQPVAAALVRLRASDGERIVISSAEADDPGVTCTWAAGPGAGATLKVQVDRRQLSDRAEPRRVRVRLSGPTAEILTIPVRIEN
jgi:hypothetical protein